MAEPKKIIKFKENVKITNAAGELYITEKQVSDLIKKKLKVIGAVTEILPLQTVAEWWSVSHNGLPAQWHIISAPNALVAGETYYVEWDNITYTCEAKRDELAEPDSTGATSYIIIGLTEAQGDEPFWICDRYNANGRIDTEFWVLAYDDEPTPHTIRIYQS